MNKLVALGVFAYSLAFLLDSAGGAEFRGLWVDAFHPGIKSPAETSAMIAKAKECNFNALFVEVRKRGNVYYRSSIEPMAPDAAPNYDSLSDVIEKGHANGLEIHAWIPVYEVFHDVQQVEADPSQVHLKHPEWLMKDTAGNQRFPGNRLFLDPGVPEARAYLVSIVEEIVGKYNVDGIHLGKVIYPSPEAGYNDLSVARFNQEKGRSGEPDKDDEAWCDWRRQQVTQFVQEAYQRITSIKPRVKVSAAVWAERHDAFHNRFQDWEAWLKAGIVDVVAPMDYYMDNRKFRCIAADVVRLGYGRHVYLGQLGSKAGAEKSVEQLRIARKMKFPGIVVFNYHYCSQVREGETSSLMDQLRVDLFSSSETIPAMGWK